MAQQEVEGCTKSKILVAFDFDHTLIDDNSDLYIRKLAPNGKLPPEISSLHSERGWTEYMGAIFQYLHESGRTKKEMKACLREIPLVEGILELLQNLGNGDRYSVIIISDANSVFIDWILDGFEIKNVVDKVYTNPANFNDDGLLTIEYYHTQDWCNLSTVNLCKGHILEDHIQKAAKQGLMFPIVAYVGDGTNDVCPCLRLGSQDVIFPREGFNLLKKLNESPTQENIKGRISPWKNGHEILSELQELKL